MDPLWLNAFVTGIPTCRLRIVSVFFIPPRSWKIIPLDTDPDFPLVGDLRNDPAFG